MMNVSETQPTKEDDGVNDMLKRIRENRKRKSENNKPDEENDKSKVILFILEK